jgi:hypothetical protein
MSASSEQSTEKAQHEGALGQVVRYLPDQSRHDPRWCREGMAISDHMGRFVDTYWTGGVDSHVLNADEQATIEHLFWLDDYREVRTPSGRGTLSEWETYAKEDRQCITSQHGLRVRYFIRNGAQPDMSTQIANAEERVRAAEEAVRSAEWGLENARRRLSELVASPGQPNGGAA